MLSDIPKRKRRTLNCNGRLVDIDRPMVMGILNLTVDSFYDGNSYQTDVQILKRCENIIYEGAGVIDIGAVSTRPGAQSVVPKEEYEKLHFALGLIKKYFPEILVSVDTYRSEVIRDLWQDYKPDFINDISGGTFDSEMFSTIVQLGVPYIMTHIQGTPETMQYHPYYENLMQEVIGFFSERINRLHSMGAKDIIIDPGFGFGKTLGHNYELLRSLCKLNIFELPILVGVSRKSMIYRLLETDAHHALNGTTAINTIALLQGADILRVHDVKEAVECVKITQQYLGIAG